MWVKRFLLHPFRVYLIYFAFIVAGVYAFMHMPVSMFPNSSKPVVVTGVPYGTNSQSSFLHGFGKSLEADLKKIHVKSCRAEKVVVKYQSDMAHFDTHFGWGDDGEECIKEIDKILQSYKSMWSEDVNRNIMNYLDSSSVGFMLGSFYSTSIEPEKMYRSLHDHILPKLKQIDGISVLELVNPNDKKLLIRLDPLKLAEFDITPSQLIDAIERGTAVARGGEFVQNSGNILVEYKGPATSWHKIKDIEVAQRNDVSITIGHLASVEYSAFATDDQIFEINNEQAVILYITPKPGANFKAISDQVKYIVNQAFARGEVSSQIHFKLTIDPGQIISKAVINVVKEIWICALIAVIVLFVFIGSITGTFTAIIEIPTSIILAFILLKITGVNINLVSLGGLALSVGMNVDASIVVIDAIVKALRELPAKADFNAIHTAIRSALKEVRMPLILATISSLVVFIPLYFTSDLAFAILGDLVLAVVYSHAISLVVALTLVPTVRLHLLKRAKTDQSLFHSKRNGVLEKSYKGYKRSVLWFIGAKRTQKLAFILVLAGFVGVFATIPSQLKREIIATPDTHILGGSIYVPHGVTLQDVQNYTTSIVNSALESSAVSYVFTAINSKNSGFYAVVLKDQKDFAGLKERLEKEAKEIPGVFINYFPFNPSELPVPVDPQMKIGFIGEPKEVFEVMQSMYFARLEHEIHTTFNSQFDFLHPPKQRLMLHPKENLFYQFSQMGSQFTINDVALLLQLAARHKYLGKITIDDQHTNMLLMLTPAFTGDLDKILNLPIKIQDHVLPLRAMVESSLPGEHRLLVRENGENRFTYNVWFSENEKNIRLQTMETIERFLDTYQAQNQSELKEKGVSFRLLDPSPTLSKAIIELFIAMLAAVGLVFFTLYARFNSFKYALVIMLAIPFGLLGVVMSLYLFESTISLNSGLGCILLIGIAVSNSILLVEKILSNYASGADKLTAIGDAAQKRIAPILMTSLTTVLGMMPIALGFGEGGSVLQPLGIAVCGGLWVSLLFTIYVVPAVMYRVMAPK